MYPNIHAAHETYIFSGDMQLQSSIKAHSTYQWGHITPVSEGNYNNNLDFMKPLSQTDTKVL